MHPRKQFRTRSGTATGGTAVLLLFCIMLSSACLAVEPEEMPPLPATNPIAIPDSPTETTDIRENSTRMPLPIRITSPRETRLYTGLGFPPEIRTAVSDFTEGRTTDTINAFLRWESVRARTSPADADRIRTRIHSIDYAIANTTLQEDITVYTGFSGEQSKRVRNESFFSENGYVIASIDPTVIYGQFRNNGRDREGYLTMCVFDFRKGDHILYVNATDRMFLIPHGRTWDVTGEETYEQMEFSADSIPRYDDTIHTNVRLIHLRERP